MKIYYLNSDKKPVGPHTKEEIISLKQAGVITDETLTAVAGDSKWRPLAEVVSDCSTWNKDGNSSAAPGEQHKELNLWACFVRGIKQYAVFKGRATRKEFWSFYLFYVIFNYAAGILGDMCMHSTSAAYEEKLVSLFENEDLSVYFHLLIDFFKEPAVIVGYGISTLYGLFMLIPFLSVSVRRLHDTGTSALPVILGCIGEVVTFGSFAYFMVGVIQNPEYFYNHFESIPVSFFAFLASLLFLLVIGIYILIKMLLPSNQCENKYGPQPRN